MDAALLVIVRNILMGKSMVLSIDFSEFLMFRRTLMGELEVLVFFLDKSSRAMDDIQYFQPLQSQNPFGDIF